jgi:Ras homolog gene family, member A
LKADLRKNRNVIELLKTHGMTPVTPQQGEDVARRMGARYTECSSKEMTGVHEVFDLAMDMAVGGGKKRKSKKKKCTIL